MSLLGFDLAGDLGGSADESATNLAQIDHVALGMARLPWQWRGSTHMLALFAIFLARYNVLEQVCQRLLLLRSIDTANIDDPYGTTGAQLDQIGAKVGQERNGLNNQDYRRYIRARIATNNSDGLRENLINIAVLIINDPDAYIKVTELYPAGVDISIQNIATDDVLAGILINFLRGAAKAGVRLTLTSTPVLPGDTFTFGSGPGFGTSSDPEQPTITPYGTTGATGAKLADVRE